MQNILSDEAIAAIQQKKSDDRTWDEVAEELGISVDFLYRIKDPSSPHARGVGISTAKKLEQKLNIPMNRLTVHN